MNPLNWLVPFWRWQTNLSSWGIALTVILAAVPIIVLLLFWSSFWSAVTALVYCCYLLCSREHFEKMLEKDQANYE